VQHAIDKAAFSILILALSAVAAAQVPAEQRSAIDRIVGAKGVYVTDDRVYKIVLPREEATIVQDYQTLSPNLGLNSWATFSPAIHQDAILAAQYLLLEDEVNPALSAALDAGLEVTGLALSSIFDGPRLYTLDVNGRGTFQDLALGFRKGLDAMRQVRRVLRSKRTVSANPSIPLASAIDNRPLDTVLSMQGTVLGGTYRAAIGKWAVVHGERVGREMGITTWVSFAGSNDRALAHGEFVEGRDELQKVLKAFTAKGISIQSIRNHAIGEEPQLVFIQFRAQGTALDIAKALRYALDVEVGTIP
jgi:hypothetical protein